MTTASDISTSKAENPQLTRTRPALLMVNTFSLLYARMELRILKRARLRGNGTNVCGRSQARTVRDLLQNRPQLIDGRMVNLNTQASEVRQD